MNHRWLVIFSWFFLLAGNGSATFPIPLNCTNSFGSNKTPQKLQNSPLKNPIQNQRNPINSYISNKKQKIEERQKKFNINQAKKFNSSCTLKINNNSQVQSVLKQWNYKLLKAQNAGAQEYAARLKNRIAALQQTIDSNYAVEDYSDMDFSTLALADDDYDLLRCQYGTKLDKVLDQELILVNIDAHNLQLQYSRNLQTQIIVPIIYECIVQAKQERDIKTAFNISDFTHDLVTILKHGIDVTTQGICAIGCGAVQGMQEFATREHFKHMLIAPIKFVGFIGTGLVDQELLDDAINNFDAKRVDELFIKMEKDNKQSCDLFKAHLCATYDHLRGLSGKEFLEQGAALGTVLLLDCIALNAAGAAANIASRAIVSEVATLFREGVPAEYALEVAGAGKVAIDKGEGLALRAFKKIEKQHEVVVKAEGGIAGVTEGEIEVCSKTLLPKYGISKEGFFNFTEKELKKVMNHIFSNDHRKKGIMNLGKDENEIFNILKNIVYDLNNKFMLKIGDNQIHTIINGCKVEIKVFLKPEGTVYMLDAFISNFARKYAHCIELF